MSKQSIHEEVHIAENN